MKFWHSVALRPPREMLDVARAAEQAGFYGIMGADHVFYPQSLAVPYPYTDDGKPAFPPDAPWPDAFCAISAMAAVTERVHFSNGVYVPGLRHLMTVARQVGTAASISDGRVALGVGVGWCREEFDAFGVEYETRGRRLDEMLETLELLWRGGWVEHHGEFFDFGPIRMDPPPPGPIPIWYGGTTKVALRRATAQCDGYIHPGPMPLEDVIAQATKVRDLRMAGPRADRPFEMVLGVTVPPTPDVVGRLEEAGVTSLMTSPWMFGTSPEEGWRAVEAFGRTYIG